MLCHHANVQAIHPHKLKFANKIKPFSQLFNSPSLRGFTSYRQRLTSSASATRLGLTLPVKRIAGRVLKRLTMIDFNQKNFRLSTASTATSGPLSRLAARARLKTSK
jgi:hypothetical protein